VSPALIDINALYINYLPKKHPVGALDKISAIVIPCGVELRGMEFIAMESHRVISSKPFIVKAALPCVKKV